MFALILALALLFFPMPVHAQTITIINPIRGPGLGHEGDDLLASLKAQWQVTKDADVRATWLLHYDVLENPAMTDFVKREMQGQELGLLFEIDRNSAEKAGVPFRGQGAWYRSDGLLLPSYDIAERRRIIDSSFATFKSVFGYYPKTVGAWWIGGDSLTYMQKKYGITAAMRAADQFNLDFYSIWGTPWNIPYLAAQNNEGIPAASFDTSSKVVILQWAIRDPLRGYADATFSLQDYSMKGYTPDYANYLASIFLKRPFDAMVMGLENAGDPSLFQQSYKNMLTKAKELASIETAAEFSKHYLTQKKVFAGQTHFLSTDFTTNNQSFWYISQNYRAALQKVGNTVSVVDLRDYRRKTDEDFSVLPNSSPVLRVDEPAVIDTSRFAAQKIVLATTDQPLSTTENDNTVSLFAGQEKIATFAPETTTLLTTRTNAPALYLFDKKELPILTALLSLRFLPIPSALVLTKLLPFIALGIAFLLRKKSKALWTATGILVLFLYTHLPYFPLDKTTILPVAAALVAISAAAFVITRRLTVAIGVTLFLALTILLSRSMYAITPFEIDALTLLRAKGRNVVFVEQKDYAIAPIYREVKPLLHNNIALGRAITGTTWEAVIRPEDHVLKLPNYDKKIFFIPRYLGSDMSEYEAESLHIAKFFDNAQIALFWEP